LNGVLSSDAKVVGVNTENIRFYLQPSLETFPVSLQGHPLREMAGMKPDSELLRRMRDAGYEYMFVDREEARKASPWFPYLDHRFLENYTLMVFSDERTIVY